MSRRFFISQLTIGMLQLDAGQSHHLRNVLRLDTGAAVDVFDRAGGTAEAVIDDLSGEFVTLRVDRIDNAAPVRQIILASAVPKGDRADWMIEKLSELGVWRFIPLITARSVVTPGENKLARWRRIATESAKQSERSGVMEIEPPLALPEFLKGKALAFFGSTEVQGDPLISLLDQHPNQNLTLLIGPEGGWTDDERTDFKTHHVKPFMLTDTILRVETAAVLAAGVTRLLSSYRNVDGSLLTPVE